ncbi:hypothetical protein CDAR_369971 [Caerostris darwini]|uniref:Uncharacterized protein n=1 Tax=Caerostris darwini TaxID=1538125 RepID=A0AAV4Q2R7_9ARAC|nr:hypothetical protein CDAR_369971 [Caerostris darwini]
MSDHQPRRFPPNRNEEKNPFLPSQGRIHVGGIRNNNDSENESEDALARTCCAMPARASHCRTGRFCDADIYFIFSYFSTGFPKWVKRRLLVYNEKD